MRRIKIALLVVLFIMCATISIFAASEYSEGYFHYKIGDESVTITGYFGEEKTVHVPSSIAGYPVSEIGSGAFPSGSVVKTLYLPDTIMKIHTNAIGEGINVKYNKVPVISESKEKNNESNAQNTSDSEGTIKEKDNEGSSQIDSSENSEKIDDEEVDVVLENDDNANAKEDQSTGKTIVLVIALICIGGGMYLIIRKRKNGNED